MKLLNVHAAARAVTARANLVALREEAKLGVTLNGKYQDEAMVEAVRPTVVAEINRQIAEIDADLLSYGVELA